MPLALGFQELQLLSWNGRGICQVCSDTRRQKMERIQVLARGRHILCFQEVHGQESEVLHSFALLLPRWRFVVSTCVTEDGLQRHAAGGVVIAICPEIGVNANIIPQRQMCGCCYLYWGYVPGGDQRA